MMDQWPDSIETEAAKALYSQMQNAAFSTQGRPARSSKEGGEPTNVGRAAEGAGTRPVRTGQDFR